MAQLVDGTGNIPYFGKLSLGNTVDWLVTMWMALILVVATVSMGSVRLDTHLLLLPMFAILLLLHGLWLAVDRDGPKRLSQVPLWFTPFLAWIAVNCLFYTPTAWRGWIELLYAVEIFIFFWVLVNNVRTRAHIGFLLCASLVPLAFCMLLGFYQVFQSPNKIADPFARFGVGLSPDIVGRAVGIFADSESFSTFLLLFLPALIFSSLVLRLPIILRILCGYAVVMVLAGLVFSGLFWPVIPLAIFLPLCALLCFKKLRPRVLFLFSGFACLSLFAGVAYTFSPNFAPALEKAMSIEGERVREVLWRGASTAFLENPVFGTGAGSFSKFFEEQESTASFVDGALTPHNDYLLVLSQYGLIGGFLLFVPLTYVYIRGYIAWKKEPYRVRLKLQKGEIVPPNKFLLSIGFGGTVAFGVCAGFTFVGYVTGLAIYGALFFGVVGKAAFARRINLPSAALVRMSYIVLGLAAGVAINLFFLKKVESHAIELHARQILDQLVDERIHLSSDPTPLNGTIALFKEAVELNPENVDAWIGLSAATTQKFYRNPGSFRTVGAEAAEYARVALELSDDYWRGWAQLGIAEALQGNLETAGEALDKAVTLAPNSSNALYFKAAFLSEFADRRAEATAAVERSLQIDPGNSAARRLQQKLMIL